jgi:hypothetical protein
MIDQGPSVHPLNQQWLWEDILNPFYITNSLNNMSIHRVLVNYSVTLNIMLLELIKKISCNKANMLPYKVVISNFIGVKDTNKSATSEFNSKIQDF